jgi:DNA-binding GntR family transcriptional regulator
MCHDRIDGDVLLLTQEFIALMLGTSRVTVTQAAQIIQNIGYIKYVRGKITILDRHGLEDVSCDCYSVVKREYDRKLN